MDYLLEKECGSYVLLSTLQVEMVWNKEPIMVGKFADRTKKKKTTDNEKRRLIKMNMLDNRLIK